MNKYLNIYHIKNFWEKKDNQSVRKKLLFPFTRTNKDQRRRKMYSSSVVQKGMVLIRNFFSPYIYTLYIYICISTQFQFKLQISRVFHYTRIGQYFWASLYYFVEHEEDYGIAALSGGAHGVLRRVTRVPTTINKIINDKMQCVKRLMKLYCCNI